MSGEPLRALLSRSGIALTVQLGEGTAGAPAAGDRPALGRYPVIGRLGAGGMGEVLEVADPDLGRTVAAKVVLGAADRAHLEKFVQEAQITGQLQHPSIVPVHELGLDPSGQVYFTMKKVEGEDLAACLAREPVAPPAARLAELLQVFLKVSDAIAFAHSRGVIHRDLKPANIMVGKFGEVQVMDWGLARVKGGPDPAADGVALQLGAGRIAERTRGDARTPLRTLDGTVVGTPAYMPPEQATGKLDQIDERSDIYALGAMLYEILAGEPPYAGRSASEVLERIVEGPPPPPSRRAPGRLVPWELEAVVLQAMDPVRTRRYASVLALRADVESFLAGGLLVAVRYSPLQRLAKWTRRHRRSVAAGAVALLAIVASASVAFWRIRQALVAERGAHREARVERDAAETARRDLLRLADLQRLAALEREADRLWPAHRRLVGRYRDWLSRAEELGGRLALHRASLEALRREGQRDRSGRWQLPDAERQWVHDNLALLVTHLGRLRLHDPREGLLADVRARLAEAETAWERSVERHRERWERARARVRAAPAYGGLDLAPQEGLVPLGPDPSSRLEEFAHLGSGSLPRREAAGKLALEQGSALVLVLLPGGTFWMGAKRSDEPGPNHDPVAGPHEGPPHEVPLAPFFLGKHEVTQAQWKRLTGASPSGFTQEKHPVLVTPLHPVEMVSWEEATDAARRAGLALPTEAQWEYAARAGTRSVWWTGNDARSLAGAASLGDKSYLRVIRGASKGETWLDDGHPVHAPVGRFRANPFGLHDTEGNVSEWCADPYHEEALRLPPRPGGGGERAFAPEWLAQGGAAYRSYRGGSWATLASGARAAFRHRLGSGARDEDLGVRVARPAWP